MYFEISQNLRKIIFGAPDVISYTFISHFYAKTVRFRCMVCVTFMYSQRVFCEVCVVVSKHSEYKGKDDTVGIL